MDIQEFFNQFMEKMKGSGLLLKEEFDAFKTEMTEKMKSLIEADKEADAGKVVALVMKALSERDVMAKAEAELEKAKAAKLELEKAKGEQVEKGKGEQVNFSANAIPKTQAGKEKGDNAIVFEMAKAAREEGRAISHDFDIDFSKAEETVMELKSKAIDGAATRGVELIPRGFATEIYARLQNVGDSLHSRFRKIPMSSPWEDLGQLLATVKIEGRKNADETTTEVTSKAITNTAEQTRTTGKQVLRAATMTGKSHIYYDLIDDTRIDLIAEHKAAHAEELSFAIDGGLVNGDSTSTHMDSDIHLIADDYRKLWKGFRRLAIDGSLTESFSSGGFTLANIDKLMKMMGKYALDPRTMGQLFWLFGVKGYHALRTIAEFKTADKAASAFTLINGNVRAYMGAPVLTSTVVREDLNTTGVYSEASGAVQTKGSCFLVNPAQMFIGVRKKLTITATPQPEDDRILLTSKMRLDFKPGETPSTTISMLAMGHNYDA